MELYTSHGAIISTAMLLVSDSILGKLYTYTPDGIRSSKTVNGTKTEYLLNGTQILAQKTGSDVMWFFYDSTGTRIGVQQGNVTAYYMYNLQGDVVGLADAATGKIIAKYLYDAWGKCVSVENADGYTIGTANPFRYRGYYYDNDTGLYYLQSRYYDPAIGRFINADAFASTDALGLLSTNMFAYCENNPISRFDPTGETFWDVFDCFMAALSWTEFINNPSLAGFGWAALDTFAILPVVPSSGYARRGVQLAESASASWDAYRAAKSLGTNANAKGRTFENWFYEFYGVTAQQVTHGGRRLDAVMNNYIIELKNYDWSKYSSYGSLATRFSKQALNYLNFVGDTIKGQKIEGVEFFFSSEPPEVIVNKLKGLGVKVDWVK